MGVVIRFTLFFAIFLLYIDRLNASEDVELKDPNLLVIATFAASSLLKSADEFGIHNTSLLHKIMDAHIVPFSQPTVRMTL